VPRSELNRLILELQQNPIGNASLRFRFQSIIQRWVLFTAYWNRTMREIESGTYRRDLARAQRHMADKGGVISEQEAIALGIPAGRARAFVDRQQKMLARRAGRPGAPAPAPAPKPAPPVVAGITDRDIDDVYRRYLETHKRVGDPRPVPSLEKIRERLQAQIPRVMAERNCRRVKLDVAVEDGKVRLKAWPVND
jgi:hypothetical protein